MVQRGRRVIMWDEIGSLRTGTRCRAISSNVAFLTASETGGLLPIPLLLLRVEIPTVSILEMSAIHTESARYVLERHLFLLFLPFIPLLLLRLFLELFFDWLP